MKKRRVIGELILALIFAFLIWITCMSFGWEIGLTMWLIGFGISAIIIIAMYFIMDGEW